MSAHSIFISYLRVDSVYAVDQLDQRLKLAFGEEAVFRRTTPGRHWHRNPI
jgi:hypothetical protein